MPATTPATELQVRGRTVRITHPDRIWFPARGLTKLDVAQYAIAVGDGLLGAVQDRPTTLERWPDGYVAGGRLATREDSSGDGFFSKRVPRGAPDWVETVRIEFPSGRSADEVCPTELAAVVWAVNMGTLTFHPWPVRRPALDTPDQLRIDLDPQPGADFADVVRAAGLAHELLDELGLEGHPKTSGGRGIHVFVRIEPRWTFTQCRRAAIAFGRELARRAPDLVTTSWWKEERGERILVDYNQMARDRTMASAYSVRANARATVSAPLRWEELPDVEPDDFDVTTMPTRFATVGDLHAPLASGPAFTLDRLLQMADRDERDGLGDEPYPPQYPKMPGEPSRVQPSRARKTP